MLQVGVSQLPFARDPMFADFSGATYGVSDRTIFYLFLNTSLMVKRV